MMIKRISGVIVILSFLFMTLGAGFQALHNSDHSCDHANHHDNIDEPALSVEQAVHPEHAACLMCLWVQFYKSSEAAPVRISLQSKKPEKLFLPLYESISRLSHTGLKTPRAPPACA